jgi:hypothetical protein
MAEMPFDVLNARLGKIRDNGDIDFDNTAAAVDIDSELQAKFLFFPIEEIEAVEIREVHRGTFHAGDGPEKCSAQGHENPAWLYNHALNALALYWRIKNGEERLARRPEPGTYRASAGGGPVLLVVNARREVFAWVSSGALVNVTGLWDEGAYTDLCPLGEAKELQ